MAEQLCDLLGMKVDDFLRLTEVHILPYLVLTRKRDLICKVAATYKNTKSPFDICSEKNNLAAILAFLLSQPSSDPEGMIMTLLAEVDPSFKGRTLAELVRTEPILIACDLLKGLGDSGDVKGERVSDFDFECPPDYADKTTQVSPRTSCSSSFSASKMHFSECRVQEIELAGSFHRGACSRYNHPIRKCCQ